jgi:outer membrane lipoprotein-sorting protein
MTAAAEEDGEKLALKIYERDDGTSSYAKIDMLLLDKQGNERPHSMVVAIKDYGPLSKRYIRFTAPAAIEGTAFLAWENQDRPDDQFIYLPELRRVRRIVSTQKSHSFVSSDFSYEDFERRKVEDSLHTLLRTETCEPYQCYVLESSPKEQSSSQYGKLVSWIVKDIYLPVKVDYFDKQNKLVKRLLGRRLEKVDDIWTLRETEMQDVVKNHRTIMTILDIRYNRNIADRIFTEKYLENPQ